MKQKMFTLFAVAILFAATTADSFAQLSLEVVWEKPQAGVIDAKFSPDGKFIYCAIGADIKKLDVATGEFVATFDKGTLIQPNQYLELSPDGKYIITLGYLGGLYLWDAQLQKLIKEIRVPGMLDNQTLGLATFLPDNKTIFLTYNTKGIIEGEVLHYNFIENSIINRTTSKPVIQQLQASKDGMYFITGSVYKDWQGNGFCKVTLWDANTLKPIRDYEVPEGNDDGFRKIQLSDNNKLIGYATQGVNGVKIIDVETGKILQTNNPNTSSTIFSLLPFEYYLICEWSGDGMSDYSMNIYKAPNIFQSSTKRYGSKTIISKAIETDDNSYKINVFLGYMTLLTNSTTSIKVPTKHEIQIKVEPEKISINFDYADSIKIIDMKGDVLLDSAVTTPSLTIPNTFSPGTYICVIKSGNKEFSQKFQVLR